MGVLLDIGVSSSQLDTADRGFSYLKDGPLDMRMDHNSGLTAATIVNTWEEAELTRIFYQYGEERWAKRIAAFITAERAINPIKTTLQLVSVIKKAVPKGARAADLHPATRCFMALRIAVNDELTALEQGLEAAKDLLAAGGRLAVICFHSLEDRIVKEKFHYWASACVCPSQLPVCVCAHQPEVKIINRRPIMASAEEIAQNPRARSAKLRVAEKLSPRF
jgi:16S rRNA (cytosine1402-N4)-methyltransferase